MGVSLQPPFRIPNSSPSQARFNPDEPKLQLMHTDSPKSVSQPTLHPNMSRYLVLVDIRHCVGLSGVLGSGWCLKL
jgi:hypothetical protein